MNPLPPRPFFTRTWIGVWLATAGVAAATGLIAILGKRGAPTCPRRDPVARRFALAFIPGLIVGVVLTGP